MHNEEKPSSLSTLKLLACSQLVEIQFIGVKYTPDWAL